MAHRTALIYNTRPVKADGEHRWIGIASRRRSRASDPATVWYLQYGCSASNWRRQGFRLVMVIDYIEEKPIDQ